VQVEADPLEVTAMIARELSIPIYGIGTGAECNGEVLIVSSILGILQALTSKVSEEVRQPRSRDEERLRDLHQGRAHRCFPRGRVHLPHDRRGTHEAGGHAKETESKIEEEKDKIGKGLS
jgi:ketopantoate hydroxymethyltransferase